MSLPGAAEAVVVGTMLHELADVVVTGQRATPTQGLPAPVVAPEMHPTARRARAAAAGRRTRVGALGLGVVGVVSAELTAQSGVRSQRVLGALGATVAP